MEAAGKVTILYGSRSDEFRIWALGDIHWFARACACNDARKTIKEIAADPHAFVYLMGDLAEWIHYLDKRFDPSTVDPEMRVWQLRNLAELAHGELLKLLAPLKGKIIGAHRGNHEASFEDAMNQQGLHKTFCGELGALDLQSVAITKLVFARKGGIKQPQLHFRDGIGSGCQCETFTVASAHGSSGATTTAGKLTVLRKFMERFRADIYLMGHLHERLSLKRTALGVTEDARRVVDCRAIGIISGAFLKTYAEGMTGYGEKKLYDPVDLGAVAVKIKPDNRELRAEI